MSFGRLALLSEEAGEASRGAELPGPSGLLARDIKRAPKAALSFRVIGFALARSAHGGPLRFCRLCDTPRLTTVGRTGRVKSRCSGGFAGYHLEAGPAE